MIEFKRKEFIKHKWQQVHDLRYVTTIQGIEVDLISGKLGWGVWISERKVADIPYECSVLEAKAAAEKMLIELFEDAIRGLVGEGKQVGITKEQILSKHLITYVTKTQKEQIFAAMDEYKFSK